MFMTIYRRKIGRSYRQPDQAIPFAGGAASLARLGRYLAPATQWARTLADAPVLRRAAQFLLLGFSLSLRALYRWGIFLLVAGLASSVHPGAQAANPAVSGTVQIPPVTTGGSSAAPTREPGSSTAVSATSIPTSAAGSNNSASGGSNKQPAFPIRAAFYYPWYPEAWKQQGFYPYSNFNPALGTYSSTDESILKQHIAMMQYGHIQAGIASWWGQGSQTDGKIGGLLSAAAGTDFRWGLYYEAEGQGNPSVNQIRDDLAFIHDHYGQDPSYLRVNGKFVVFVYSDGTDRCDMADRWKQGNSVGAYIVLRIFPGYAKCASQPDSWHQYSPARAEVHAEDMSYSISPGFWLKGNAVRLDRDTVRWSKNVRDMIASKAEWQLITTFNEWGEGTAVEPAAEWPSPSGYGPYLDALHANGGGAP